MSLCKTCAKAQKDWQLHIDMNPDKETRKDRFRTWMICAANIDGFPWKEECKDYEPDGN